MRSKKEFKREPDESSGDDEVNRWPKLISIIIKCKALKSVKLGVKVK